MSFRNVKIITAICCLFFITITISPTYALNATDISVLQSNKPVTHKVQKGETVYSIAQKYNTTITEIYLLNPQAMEGIKVGSELKIPSATLAPASSVTTYKVQKGETLYSIAKINGVKVDDIINANPELRTKPLADGQILRIPPASASNNQPSLINVSYTPPSKSEFISHTVAPKETLYGISKKYNIGTDAIIDFNPAIKDGLKEGTVLIIPILDPATNQKSTLQNANMVSVGVVLPFINKSNAQTARFIEYYEGFLVALQELKAKGFSANIYAFDMGSETGTEKLKSLLDTYEMKYLDLIIGGVSPEQIAVISDFARKQGIKYAIPFPTKTDNTYNNPYIFQVNAPHSVLYSNVARTFVNQFPNSNIIYLTESGSDGDRADFISALNNELPRAGMIANRAAINSSLKERLTALLDPARRNIIIPTSASLKTLQAILPVLGTIRSESPATPITLFGHTDWQTYNQYNKELGQYDTYIYTPFYPNETDFRTTQFLINYRKWYNDKNLINTYPKYGALGYDTGISFLSALWRYGKNFESNTNSMAVSSLQTPFLFRKTNPMGGYMNTGFYLVHYKEDGTIEKTEYGR